MTDPLGLPIEALRETDTPVESMRGRGITIGFATTNKLISRAIRWITRGKVSHAWIAYDDFTLGLRMVLQAESWGFEVRPWFRWALENKWVAEFRFTDGAQHAALRRLARSIGLRYDWLSGFWVGLSAWFKRWWKARLPFRLDRTPRRLMCSEAVVRFLKDAGCRCAADLDEEVTSPAELYDIVRCSTEFTAVKRGR
jgi:hypothetical protein